MNLDCSYSGSWIDRTYWTTINHTAGTDHDVKYELNAANYQQTGGLRSYHDVQRCLVDI